MNDQSGCSEYKVLQDRYIAIRSQISKLVITGTLTPDVERELLEKELKALWALQDHRMDHHCVAPGE